MLRRQYRPTDSRVILPTNTVTPRRRSLFYVSLITLTALVLAGGAAVLYARSRPQEHVTLDSPSFDTDLTPVHARTVRRDEIANGLIEFVPFKTIVAKLRDAMERHSLQCITANAIGIPARVMIMAIEQELIIINPVITWTSASETSQIMETCPLYTYADPVPMTRPHRVQVKFVNQWGSDQIIMMAGKESHCIQSSIKLFRGKTVYND